MNQFNSFRKTGNHKEALLQPDSKTSVLNICSMCKFKTNSLLDLKQHLIMFHVEPPTGLQPIKQENLLVTSKNEEDLQRSVELKMESQNFKGENHFKISYYELL
jgi:hypothetical protein